MISCAEPIQKQETKSPVQKKDSEKSLPAINQTGIPDSMKSRFENLSGYSFDDVRVHYNSGKPAQLQALAYTQGNQVFVAPGQEKHLGHELGHVVQQKQGRVNATGSISGISINDNAELENEAELLSNDDHEAQIEALNNTAHSSQVIQRMVGFEFETGWLVEKEVDVISRDSEGFWGIGYVTTKKVRKRLEKKELIGRYSDKTDGFHIEADDAAEGKSEIEFVTRPVSTKDELILVIENIQKVRNMLIAEARSNAEFRKWGLIITPRDLTLNANPQMTFGMQLSKLDRFITDQFISHIDKTGTILEACPNLAGLVRLMNKYIVQGRKRQLGNPELPFSYPKQIADTVMARTDFSKLLRLAVRDDAINVEQHLQKVQWLALFQGLGINLDKNLFDRGILKDHTKEDELITKLNESSTTQKVDEYNRIRNEYTYTPSLTVRKWLESVYDGTDLLAEIKDREGMGALGGKTDIEAGEKVGIFEHRALQRIEPGGISDWKKFALDWFNRVTTANAPVQHAPAQDAPAQDALVQME